MKKSCILLLLLTLLTGQVWAQTEIANGESVSGKWTKQNSPYIVLGEVTVPKGKTLRIEPGVEVRFLTSDNREYQDDNFELGILRVSGILKAEGTAKEPIRFTRDGDEGQWGCIHIFSGDAKSVIKWCIIEYSHYVRELVEAEDGYDNATGALSFYASGGRVENCLIRKSWAAINAKMGAQPALSHCTIVENEYGLESNRNPVVGGSTLIEAESCILFDNANGFFVSEVGGVAVSHSFVQDGQWDDNVNDVGDNITDSDDPGFSNPDKKDFRLKKKSVCKGKGKDGTNMGAY